VTESCTAPESSTTPVVLPDEYRLSTACGEQNMPGALKRSKKYSAAFSRLVKGFRGDSVSNTCKEMPWVRRSEG
jgi:hypothetical protein